MQFSKKTLKRLTNKFAEPGTHYLAFVAFFVILFFTGGGSRDDIQSLLLLRPIAVLFCAFALITKAPEQWRGRMFPLYIVGAFMILMLVQLIPLPPSIWTGMPGRQMFADIADIAGIEQPWRPLTLSPSRTLNSLFSLAVPVAAMMLYLNLDREYRNRVIPVFIILCSISAIWAIFQMVGPPRGPLYIYSTTNFGTGVGLFANRNHQAVMLASTIAMLGWYAASLKKLNANKAAVKFYGCLATILVLIPLIFVTGSRAGLILMVPALLFALFQVNSAGFRKDRSRGNERVAGRKFGQFSDRLIILAMGLVAIIGLAVLSVLFSRSEAFDRLFASNDIQEMRVQLLPTLSTMLESYMPWGSGFGTFEHVYKIFEPQELLRLTYLNQAHNDWLQLPIEGGVPAMFIATSALIWFASRFWILLKNLRKAESARYRGLMCAAVMIFLLIASIGDYPLRTPIIVAVFVVLACLFNDSVRSIQRREIHVPLAEGMPDR